jgi:hypothetical protein
MSTVSLLDDGACGDAISLSIATVQERQDSSGHPPRREALEAAPASTMGALQLQPARGSLSLVHLAVAMTAATCGAAVCAAVLAHTGHPAGSAALGAAAALLGAYALGAAIMAGRAWLRVRWTTSAVTSLAAHGGPVATLPDAGAPARTTSYQEAVAAEALIVSVRAAPTAVEAAHGTDAVSSGRGASHGSEVASAQGRGSAGAEETPAATVAGTCAAGSVVRAPTARARLPESAADPTDTGAGVRRSLGERRHTATTLARPWSTAEACRSPMAAGVGQHRLSACVAAY